MRALAHPRRWAGGLWGLALLGALVVPVVVHVSAAHHAHWAGVAQGPYWRGLVLPWSGRLQALVGVFAVGGWAAWAAPADPRAGRRILLGLIAGLGGFAVTALAATPPWVWLHRLGAAPVGPLVKTAALAALAVGAAGAVAGAGGSRLPGGLAAALGTLSGLGLVWLTWGAFG
ncbi:MAG: hypothetical protein H6702_13655 [Myxococcales bacterium]|nr:hypothetical protein [Myxococcales bacterium]